MKSTLFILILALIAGLITGCGKGTGNSRSSYGQYGNYNYNNGYGYGYGYGYGGYSGGYYGSNAYFGGVSSIVNLDAYHDYLRGDFCTHWAFFDFSCKWVDDPPAMTLTLGRLEMPAGNNGSINGQLTIRINGYSYQQYVIPLVFVYGGSTNVLVGQNRDWNNDGRGGTRQIRVYLSGLNKNSQGVNVDVQYEYRPMLSAYLHR